MKWTAEYLKVDFPTILFIDECCVFLKEPVENCLHILWHHSIRQKWLGILKWQFKKGSGESIVKFSMVPTWQHRHFFLM